MASTELNITYTLTGPTGARAVFNDQNDPDFVGMLTEVTGLDSPDVRESAEDMVQQDGGIHGNFYYGRRPITLTGIILNPASAAARNVRLDKLAQASDAMRSDALLTWTPTGGVPMQASVRRQQPLRVSGAWQKSFQLGLVAADARLYSQALHSTTLLTPTSGPAAGVTLGSFTNLGNTTTDLIFDVTGPGGGPYMSLSATVDQIFLPALTVPAGQVLTINTKERTAKLNGVSVYQYVSFPASYVNWVLLPPGTRSIGVSYTIASTTTSASKFVVSWRDAWI